MVVVACHCAFHPSSAGPSWLVVAVAVDHSRRHCHHRHRGGLLLLLVAVVMVVVVVVVVVSWLHR